MARKFSETWFGNFPDSGGWPEISEAGSVIHKDSGVGSETFRCNAYGALLGRGIGTQGVLDPVAQLREHTVRNVLRVLGDEVDADPFGPDQTHNLLHFLDQPRLGIAEQQVSLVKEEHQLGLVGVAGFGEFLEQLRDQPEHKGGVELGRGHEGFGAEDIDHTVPLRVGAHQVLELEGRFADELIAALASSVSRARWIAPTEAVEIAP